MGEAQLAGKFDGAIKSAARYELVKILISQISSSTT
jgi:hypothetical protein